MGAFFPAGGEGGGKPPVSGVADFLGGEGMTEKQLLGRTPPNHCVGQHPPANRYQLFRRRTPLRGTFGWPLCEYTPFARKFR